MKIYQKHRTTQCFQAIADEIVRATKDLTFYSDVTSMQCCYVGKEAIRRGAYYVYGSFLSFNIPDDGVHIRLYKILGLFPQRMPNQLELKQHIQNLSIELGEIAQSLRTNFGGQWLVVMSARSSEWVIATYPENNEIIEVQMRNGQYVSVIYCIRNELCAVIRNQLSANGLSVPKIIGQICHRYHETGDFHKISHDILDCTCDMEPFCNSSSTIRCIICTDYDVSELIGTRLEMFIANYVLLLFQDRSETATYDRSAATSFLQQLAARYNPHMCANEAITQPLEEEFDEFHWNCAIIYEKDFSHSAIATKPPNLPMIEAQGPNGECIYAWAMQK